MARLHRPVPGGAAARRALRARLRVGLAALTPRRAVMNGTQKQTPKLFFAAGPALRTVRPPALLPADETWTRRPQRLSTPGRPRASTNASRARASRPDRPGVE